MGRKHVGKRNCVLFHGAHEIAILADFPSKAERNPAPHARNTATETVHFGRSFPLFRPIRGNIYLVLDSTGEDAAHGVGRRFLGCCCNVGINIQGEPNAEVAQQFLLRIDLDQI